VGEASPGHGGENVINSLGFYRYDRRDNHHSRLPRIFSGHNLKVLEAIVDDVSRQLEISADRMQIARHCLYIVYLYLRARGRANLQLVELSWSSPRTRLSITRIRVSGFRGRA